MSPMLTCQEDATERPLSPASTDRAVDAILGDNTVVHVKDIPDGKLSKRP